MKVKLKIHRLLAIKSNNEHRNNLKFVNKDSFIKTDIEILKAFKNTTNEKLKNVQNCLVPKLMNNKSRCYVIFHCLFDQKSEK